MSNIVNVLVHGLFFMRMSLDGKKNLELIVPKIIDHGTVPHHFLAGVRKPKALKESNVDVPWLNIGLMGGSPGPLKVGTTIPSDVKSSILQLSIPECQLGDWNPANFLARVFLPWPQGFYSVRCDYFDRAFLYQASNVGNKINAHCRGSNPNAKVGFITCLQYGYDPAKGISLSGWTPGTNLHCYFEPCQIHTISEVNKDLCQAAYCFVNFRNFDLLMDKSGDVLRTERGEKCPDTPQAVNSDDDYSLPEDPFATSEGICPATVQLENINSSNCPNFFVGNNP